MFTALFLVSSLHWPAREADLGGGGVSYLELLILYEIWSGERLVLEKAVSRRGRAGRPISVSASLPDPGIVVWRSCWFLGRMLRSLRALPGGLGRFMPCGIGGNHCRLRHIGLEMPGRGLSSWPTWGGGGQFEKRSLAI